MQSMRPVRMTSASSSKAAWRWCVAPIQPITPAAAPLLEPRQVLAPGDEVVDLLDLDVTAE